MITMLPLVQFSSLCECRDVVHCGPFLAIITKEYPQIWRFLFSESDKERKHILKLNFEGFDYVEWKLMVVNGDKNVVEFHQSSV